MRDPVRPARRDDLYDPTTDDDARDVRFEARLTRDMTEARARGWTGVELSVLTEPPVPVGRPPLGVPFGAARRTRIPDYGAGEAGGYWYTR